ncbi:MAG TPA: CcdB family protein [Steroidobacteraceae bacterium]|nr:CcdB family protein [Steroidobacteraceae bacterium]
MPQFAVYRNKNLRNRALFPLLLDVQPDLFQDLETRLVIPLSNAFALKDFPLAYLTPEVVLDGERYLLMTPQLAGVARADLGPHMGSICGYERAISRAIDFLLRGF